MPFAALDGVNLFYEVTGSGPETIVFAHGSGGNHLVWYQQVSYFSPRYRCVTYDQRGFGQSTDKSGEHMAALPRDLGGLLDHLDVRAAFLVAQSMGTASCSPFTVDHPNRVRKLLLADTRPTRSLTSLEETAQRIAAAVAVRGPNTAFAPDFPQQNPAAATLYHQIAALNPARTGDAANPERTRAATRILRTEELQRLTVPVLFIVGSEDDLIPPALIAEAQALIPGSRMETVRGAGHSVYWEKPNVFNHIVDRFFSAEVELSEESGERDRVAAAALDSSLRSE